MHSKIKLCYAVRQNTLVLLNSYFLKVLNATFNFIYGYELYLE